MMDADGMPAPDALRWMVPHLVRLPQVAAVTDNPRVANTRTLLCRLQSVEFSATVSVLRRALGARDGPGAAPLRRHAPCPGAAGGAARCPERCGVRAAP